MKAARKTIERDSFDRPPNIAGVRSSEVQAWLDVAWPGLTTSVIQCFLRHSVPWSCLLYGPHSANKALLAWALVVLAGGARFGHGHDPGAGARRRLRLRDDKPVTLEFLLYGQRSLHALPMFDGGYGSVETPFVGYGRALAVQTEPPPDAWRGLSEGLYFLEAVDGPDLDAETARGWVRSPDGQPGALVKHLAWMGLA